MSVKLSPIEVLGESFILVFFAEWGDRSMLATMALGAAQSPLGVASGAISGHLLATFIAVLGGSFISHYISEKLSGYICGTNQSQTRNLPWQIWHEYFQIVCNGQILHYLH
ncbi:protein PAM71-homolog, chloroplastic-like [Primulina huaijiensis]|uniref:protein PAM71-homolog, chloroplastic-like n=1 Tax=Primulina huaijiensis TaxID=1492673 RepID=UPI003CC76070